MLVGTDEDVRGAERELAFAEAEFGPDAVSGFAAALGRARAATVQAFAIRQQLDDAIPEDEVTQRQMLADIAAHCVTSPPAYRN
jgi:hypothetical protein